MTTATPSRARRGTVYSWRVAFTSTHVHTYRQLSDCSRQHKFTRPGDGLHGQTGRRQHTFTRTGDDQPVHVNTRSHVQAMVCMVRLGDVETALEYAERQRITVTQLAQVM